MLKQIQPKMLDAKWTSWRVSSNSSREQRLILLQYLNFCYFILLQEAMAFSAFVYDKSLIFLPPPTLMGEGYISFSLLLTLRSILFLASLFIFYFAMTLPFYS